MPTNTPTTAVNAKIDQLILSAPNAKNERFHGPHTGSHAPNK